MLIDSGSDWDLLSESDWHKLDQAVGEGKATIMDMIENPNESARAYGSVGGLQTMRSFHAWIEVSGATKPRIFSKIRVIRNGDRSILSHRTSIRMKLLRIGTQVNTISEDKPKEFPSIPDLLLEFDIDDSVPPTKNAYVNIPAAYRDKAIERLSRMELEGIIEKVLEAPRWISGMSAVPKGNDDFRLVINMIGPNRAIKRRFYKMPTIDEIKVELHGAKFFTKLDLTNAFYHIMLAEKSREMTTFLGPSGMFRFRRLVFGVNCAPEMFQQTMEDILRGISGVIVYIDDLLIFAEEQQTLREITKRVLAALKKNNLTVNEAKCDYEKQRLEFLGHELSQSGFNITERKVKDVRNFRTPRSISELKSFLGLASFLSSYIRNFADIAKPLWDSTKGREFSWKREQAEAFEKLKTAIIDCTKAQGFFSNNDKTSLYTDASPVALGAVLVQEDPSGKKRIISFASKLLTPTEGRYPQTQKEALAIVWASEHFWFYLLGRKFTLNTDAQGISLILKKERTSASKILSRAAGWALRMTRFNFDVGFIAGKDNIADPSSRLVEGEGHESFEEEPAPGEIMHLEAIAPSDVEFDEGRITLEEVRFYAERDETLKAIVTAIENNHWPKNLRAYKSIKDELRLSSKILTRMGAIVMPEALRQKTLQSAHRGHPGERAMKSILTGKVWWPSMLAQAERWVKSCKPCTLMGRRNAPMPMQRSELPEAQWEELAIDFNGPYSNFGGILVLVIVDSYSRFVIAKPVKHTSFEAARTALEEVFSIYGYPKAIKHDGGPPFNGREWAEYLKSRDITKRVSTPLDAQTNGGVETYMRIVNKGMTAPSIEGGDWKASLADTIAAHNAAICVATNERPEELMFGRRLKRNLPVIGTHQLDDIDMRKRDHEEKMKAKARDDAKRGAKFSDIVVGDKVHVARQTRAKGDTAFHPMELTVVSKNHGTLELLSPSGTILKRTVTFVKKAIPRYSETAASPPRQEKREGRHVAEAAEAEIGQQKPSKKERKKARKEALQPEGPRRSERLRNKPARLGKYIGLLEWSATL